MFKMNISKTKMLEIYKLENNNYIIYKKIIDKDEINDFIKIFKNVQYETNPTMTTPILEYKIIFYNKKGKEIAEVKCFPNIISDKYGVFKLKESKMDLLKEQLKLFFS